MPRLIDLSHAVEHGMVPYKGLPAPIVWGAVMALLATIPVMGTFVVWAPAAVYLAASGEWVKAAILVGWGAVAIGLIDNFLYPMLVGRRLRFAGRGAPD